MAPTSGKRSSIRSRASRPSTNVVASADSRFRNSKGAFGTRKKDKRLTKRSALISRIEKSTAPSKKRRRPSKKLITNLESLANALPEIPSNPEHEVVAGPSKIKYKSLKHKPGAMKKKESLINMEKERFNRNMAALQCGNVDMTSQGEATDVSKGKWATLREFIQQTMEKRPDS